MSQPATIEDYAQLKLIAEPQRRAILRHLMAGAATLSQLGERLGASPARVRHHVKALEAAGLVELVKTRQVRGFVEKYYRATARAYTVNLVVLPETAAQEAGLTLGSNDHALARFSEGGPVQVTILGLDSLSGLMALRQANCTMAGCHLLDPDTSEYNRSYVRHFFPGENMVLIHLGEREEGLIVAAGNPLGLRSLDDLARPDVRMINRRRGSGTRVWFDRALAERGMAADAILGYPDEADSHAGIVRSVQEGAADVGVGLLATAREAGLEAIPLFEEPYDLVVGAEAFESPPVQRFCDHLTSAAFRSALNSLDGYRATPATGRAERVG